MTDPRIDAVLAVLRSRDWEDDDEQEFAAAAIVAADVAGWQSIETAPRDGTEFDGWVSTGRVENVSWDPDWNDRGGWLRRIDGVHCVTWQEVDEPMQCWRPLPPAPGDA